MKEQPLRTYVVTLRLSTTVGSAACSMGLPFMVLLNYEWRFDGGNVGWLRLLYQCQKGQQLPGSVAAELTDEKP
jgi:hypothetical protein